MPKNKPTRGLTMNVYDVCFQNTWGEFVVVTAHGLTEAQVCANARLDLPQPWDWEVVWILPAQ